MSTQQIAPDLPVFSNFQQDSQTPGLNPRRATFAYQFVFGPFQGNGLKSAVASGYTEKSAGQTACLLLKNEKVRREIARLAARKHAKLEISSDKVLQEIARLAYMDPRKLFKSNGELIPVTELPDDIAGSVAGIEVEAGKHGTKVTKVKLADKGQNLERLGRHLKLFTDRLEIDIGGNLADLLDAARKRTRAELDSVALESAR